MILADGGSVFDPIYNFFGTILAFFYGLVPNLGVSIIMLTIVVMLALFPLTAKQAKSMMAMQRAQPEIKKLQAKYKGDRQKLNEEMMKYYQENKINPLAGCLPLLIQTPIFIALFQVMKQAVPARPEVELDLYAAFCTNSARARSSGRRRAASGKLPNPLYFLGIDLSQSATASPAGSSTRSPTSSSSGLVILTGFFQARQNRRNSPNMTNQMAMITNILPIVFGVFSLQFPAGLVLYFLVSNLWRLGQQELILHKITRPGMAAHAAATGGAIDVKSEPADEPKAPGGLRKLFQLPAATNGDATNGERRQRRRVGWRPDAKQPGSGTGAKGKPGSAGAKPGGSGAQQSSSGSSSRRTNKKRKRR